MKKLAQSIRSRPRKRGGKLDQIDLGFRENPSLNSLRHNLLLQIAREYDLEVSTHMTKDELIHEIRTKTPFRENPSLTPAKREESRTEWVKKFLSDQDVEGLRMTMGNVWGESDELDDMSKKKIISQTLKNEKGEIDEIYVEWYGYTPFQGNPSSLSLSEEYPYGSIDEQGRVIRKLIWSGVGQEYGWRIYQDPKTGELQLVDKNSHRRSYGDQKGRPLVTKALRDRLIKSRSNPSKDDFIGSSFDEFERKEPLELGLLILQAKAHIMSKKDGN